MEQRPTQPRVCQAGAHLKTLRVPATLSLPKASPVVAQGKTRVLGHDTTLQGQDSARALSHLVMVHCAYRCDSKSVQVQQRCDLTFGQWLSDGDFRARAPLDAVLGHRSQRELPVRGVPSNTPRL